MYYEVLVASQRYHKSEALTYSSQDSPPIGSIVEVSLQRQPVLGIVIGKVAKPKFDVKPISNVIQAEALSVAQLNLIDWLKAYYPAPGGLIHGLFAPTYLRGPVSQPKLAASSPALKEPPLTSEQIAAIKTIQGLRGHSALLHGTTGSGKTRVYTQLAKEMLDKEHSVIILTPEIGLTPQLTKSFTDLFDRVIVLHSSLTPKERRGAWFTLATSNKPWVVIGPRSALFAPLKSIGLIVVDEMHDSAYKQEQAPYFATTRVAAKLAELSGAKAILASATPPVADYYIFEQGKLPIIEMKENATASDHKVENSIIDLKDREQFSRSSWLSESLLRAVEQSLKNSEQSLLFLNRRGTARIILCQICGWQATCPRCDLPLTYHGDSHQAICHTCGHNELTPSACPNCGSTEIVFKSAGTKTIVSELERLFPKAVIKRFDSDLKKGERLQTNFAAVSEGKIDILVGTQMLGKGLDLPKLSVVGVILADTALNFPDYTAEERTFQMLNQVFGRVDRGHRAGQVIVQTYNPKSTVIMQALAKDYIGFYKDQLKERQQFNFPPFCYLLKLTGARRSQAGIKKAAHALLAKLQVLKLDITIIGPAPAFVEKNNDLYRWQLVIKAAKRSDLLRIIPLLPANWQYDIDPAHLL